MRVVTSLVLDPGRIGDAALLALVAEFRKELDEVREMATAPTARVTNPGGLDAAITLLDAAAAAMDRPGPRDGAALAADANLGYAAMVAAIALVKSSTDVPRVPPPRPVPTS